MAELGGKQLSTLLESLPGIASVLRSPVADAIANMIRAGAGLGEFREDDVRELIQYATRRGLMGNDEGDQIVSEVKGIWKKKSKRSNTKPKRAVPAAAAKSKTPAAPRRALRPDPKATALAAAERIAAAKAAALRADPPRREPPKKDPPKEAPAKKATAKKAAVKKPAPIAKAKKAAAQKSIPAAKVKKAAAKPKTVKKAAAKKSVAPKKKAVKKTAAKKSR